MASREDLHRFLLTLCPNVYFKAPGKQIMKYPAIKYERTTKDKVYADNDIYHLEQPYSLTVIDYVPDSPIVEALCNLPRCKQGTPGVIDNLYHDYFTIYY